MSAYFESKFVIITWNARINAVQLTWKGLAEGAPFKEGLEKGLELFKAKKATRWLGDTSLLPVISQPDQEWVNSDWFPRLISAGLKEMAVVVPTKMVGKLGVKRVVDKAVSSAPFSVEYFESLPEAEKWILTPATGKKAS